MKIRIPLLVFAISILFSYQASAQEIPIEHLAMNLPANMQVYSKPILENEITGIDVTHITITDGVIKKEYLDQDHKYIYLFIKGEGNVIGNNQIYNIVPETIILPNSVQNISISAARNDTLHFLKISSELTEQDISDLKEFPRENTDQIYYAKFIDCEAYTEPIKSPNTVSRTVLPNRYIPRIAMGTVDAPGPDAVGAHEHGMLEQLFLGLTDNQVVVYADDAKIDFPAYSILHIPLGSSHSVSVEDGDKMYYMWLDFFRDKKGEAWLNTHKKVEEK